MKLRQTWDQSEASDASVLDEMVKRPFVDVGWTPKICQVLADLIADRNRKAKKANKHIGQGDASFRDSNSKGQPNLSAQSAPKIAAMPVLFFRGVHPQNAHGITEAFSPKSIRLGEVREDHLDGCHDLLGLVTSKINTSGDCKKTTLGTQKIQPKRFHIIN